MRFISLCLIITIFTGCAGPRHVRFDSWPVGATVQFAGATCITPCQLPVAKQLQFAQVSLAGRGEKLVRVEGRPSVSTRVGYGISHGTAVTLKWISLPLLAVGGFGLILFSGNETDSFSNRSYQYDHDAFYITIGALVAGGALALMANGMEDVSSDLKPQEDVFVVFEVPEEKRGGSYQSPLRLDDLTGGTHAPVVVH